MKPNLVAPLRFTAPVRRTLSAISIALSLVCVLAAVGATQGTSWTYQGQLRRSGAAYNGTCNFQFSLWSAVSAGTQVGTTQAINGVNVVNGLFTATLDFGDVFNGFPVWLGTSVQCSSDGGFTPLDPRQSISATPYALTLRPGAFINDYSGGATLQLRQSGPYTSASALVVDNEGAGRGIFAASASGIGVWGGSSTGTGVYGFSESGTAISGYSYATEPAIYGANSNGGPAGKFVGPVAIEGRLNVSNTPGVGLSASGITAVAGSTTSATGIGVHGSANGAEAMGVFGTNVTGIAVLGVSQGTGAAIYGQNTAGGFAGRFTGPVLVEGNLIVQGSVSKNTGSFRIDHPLDPANKFLSHSFVESPDMMNIYNGNITTDATGSAVVALPEYFEALNRDFRYQLTVVGRFAQAIVSRKVVGNSFEIRTDKPGVEVSWQVTGIRQDAYARAKPIVVEEFKPAEEKGLYLYPAGFGAGEEKQIGYPSRPATPQKMSDGTK